MDTLRVDISYRPLRIGWAICAGDFVAYRKAVRFSCALWGGRFNPIIIVDQDQEASRLIDLFRVDIVLPIGDSDFVKEYPKKHSHLINPFYHDAIFIKGTEHHHPYAQVLDIHNALVHLRDTPNWKHLKARGVRLFSWQLSDPLSDVLLAQLGGYPSTDDVGTDYRAMLLEASEGTDSEIGPASVIPTDVIKPTGISYIARYGLRRHYSVRSARSYPGFFVGSAASHEDLVCHWNLRACDIPLWFVDADHLGRYSSLIPAWRAKVQELVANHRHEWTRNVAVWTRSEDLDLACRPFGDAKLFRCHVSDATWNGRNVSAPTMQLGEASVLGVVGTSDGKPRVTFALHDKPFCGDRWFYQQHLVASVRFIGGLHGDEQNTFAVPYLPELNEFYARTMHFDYNKLRVEPERIGIVIDAADTDSHLRALSVGELFERVFALGGYTTKPSSAGLILRQLLTRLGGVQGARVFKVPGVRRLLKTYGPGTSFTKRAALQLIGQRDPDRPAASFSDHNDLYIEPRPYGEKLTTGAVFKYLVAKGLFRIGIELTCPACHMHTWTSLDNLKHMVTCDLCGAEHDATPQLTDLNEWHYRRSGILGSERNAQGAVPVALTLQQLGTSLSFAIHDGVYSPSLDLTPINGSGGPPCEVDFVWIVPRDYPRKTAVIIGECKDEGPITSSDIQNLRTVADALPRKRFKTFVVLSQVCPFSKEEIENAKKLNDEHRRRVIMLTARELEPYFVYEKTKAETGIEMHGASPEDMAEATEKLYFENEA